MTPMTKKEAIDQLMHRKAELNQQKGRLIEKQSATIKEISSVNTQISQINKQIEDIKKGKFTLIPTVTEHALVRFLQRVSLVDVEAIREKIITPEVMEQIKELGDGRYPCNEYILVVAGNRVVTILNQDGQAD